MNYYQHHIGDFNNSTRHLTRVERSLYRDLIELYYDKEQPLTSDTKVLCRKIIAKTDEEIEAVEQILSEFFILTNEVYMHKKCQSIIDNYKENLTKKSKAGKASAIARAKKTTQVEQVLSKCATNHKPITNNHKPLTIDQESDEKKPPKRKRFIKPTYDQVFEQCHDSTQTERFINHYESNGWKVGRNKMANWKACLANWMKRQDEYNGTHQRNNSRSMSAVDRVKQAVGYAENERVIDITPNGNIMD